MVTLSCMKYMPGDQFSVVLDILSDPGRLLDFIASIDKLSYR